MVFPRSSSARERLGRQSRVALILGAAALLALLLLINQATPSVPREAREGDLQNPDPPPRLVAKWSGCSMPLAFLSGQKSPTLVTTLGGSFGPQRVRIFDALSGETLATLSTKGQNHIGKVAGSPDGKYLAVSGIDRVGDKETYPVHVWEVATAKEVCVLPGDKLTVGGVVFSPDSRRLIYTQDGNLIKLWNIPSGKLVRSIATPPDGAWDAVVTPDGRRIVTPGFNDGTIRTWDIATGKQVRTLRDKRFGYAGIVLRPPDGKLAAVSAYKMYDSAICLWDLENERLLATLRQPVESVQGGCVFHKNGRWLATNNLGYYNVSIWDVFQRKVLHKLPLNGVAREAIFSPDGRWLAASADNDKECFVAVWDMYPE